MQRRLAAILAADVVGYSRLMAEDEEATLSRLKAHRSDVFDPAVADHNGRIIKLIGDGTLVEFSSVVDAVNCAVAIQSALANGDGSLRLRMGINLGDVIVDGDDVYGDGVNIAARLEGLAQPGGICISDPVHQSVRAKTDVTFKDIGIKTLKNIDDAIRVFSWPPSAHGTSADGPDETRVAAPSDPNMLLVVPFRVLGTDATAQGLADALTETIAVAMSHFDELSILDPSAVPADADVKSGREIGRDLNVLYLLAGSVQGAGGRVRVSVQVIEVATGRRQWSDSFDRDVNDIFALQDDLTAIVASTVGEALMDLMSKALDKKPETEWSARELTIRGISHLHRMRREHIVLARGYFQRARARDPKLPLAEICECWTYLIELMRGWPLTVEDTIDHCLERVERLLARNDRQSQAHRIMTRLRHLSGDHRSALIHAERAYELNPFDTDILLNLGQSLSFTGDGKRGAELIERAVKTNPYAPDFYKDALAAAYLTAERYDDALAVLEKSVHLGRSSLFVKVACLVLTGRHAEARREMGVFLETQPEFTVEKHARALPFQEGPDLDRFLSALSDAGLPNEEPG